MSSEYKRIRDYELMVVFHPELSEEDLAAQVSRVEEHVTTAEGSIRLVNRELPWGRRRLAYPIRHGSRDVRDGVYVLYYFTSESGKIEDIEREIKLDDRILRYLLTQQSAPMMEPAPVEVEEGTETDAAATSSEESSTETTTGAKRASRASVEADVTEAAVEPETTDASAPANEPMASAEPEADEAALAEAAAEPEPEMSSAEGASPEAGTDESAQASSGAESTDETPE